MPSSLVGLIILGVVLFWVFKDAQGSANILNSLAQQNNQFLTALRGGQ
jgi:hypothetical protein